MYDLCDLTAPTRLYNNNNKYMNKYICEQRHENILLDLFHICIRQRHRQKKYMTKTRRSKTYPLYIIPDKAYIYHYRIILYK